MQAQIRKLKITKSIIDQSINIDYRTALSLPIVGWCISKTGKKTNRWVVCQGEHGVLFKTPYIFEVTKRPLGWQQRDANGNGSQRWEVEVCALKIGARDSRKFWDEGEAILFFGNLSSLRQKSLKAGQFYL